MKKIALLTYPIKHRKTFDTLSLLKANGYEDVSVYISPFTYQKKKYPVYEHRPEMDFNIPDIEVLCANLGYKSHFGNLGELVIPKDATVLVAGAGLLPREFVESHTIINAHPGYIPNCRGLDAFKWAIVEDQPIGVTTHLIGEYIDAGFVIDRKLIPVYTNDTFHAVAQRVYENEVTMLVEAIIKLDESPLGMIIPNNREVHKRMPEEIEISIIERFEKYKQHHGITRNNM